MDFSLLYYFVILRGIGSYSYIHNVTLFLQSSWLYTFFFFFFKIILPINTLFCYWRRDEGGFDVYLYFILIFPPLFLYSSLHRLLTNSNCVRNKKGEILWLSYYGFSIGIFFMHIPTYSDRKKRKLFREVNLLVIFEISFHKFFWCLSLITEIRGNTLLEKCYF